MTVAPGLLRLIPLLVLGAGLWSPAGASAGPADSPTAGRWRPLQPTVTPGMTWMSVEGTRIALGAGRHVRLGSLTAGGALQLDGELKLDAPADAGLLVGRRLYLAGADGRLLALNLHDGHGHHPEGVDDPRPFAVPGRDTDDDLGTDLRLPVPLPLPRAASRKPARAGDLLVLVEDGFGLRLLALPGHHAAPGALPAEVGRVELAESFTAVAAFGNTVVAATRQNTLVLVDVTAPRPRVVRRVLLPGAVNALALQGHRLVLAGPGGVSTLDLDDVAGAVLRPISDRTPSALHLAGRQLITLGEAGLETWRDVDPAAALVPVTVSSNFFSPGALEVSAGDTVRWSLSFGFHNVFSCTVGQLGCTEAANESFSNGPPTDGPWVFTHTFAAAGTNPYVCQSHAPAMTGTVTVTAGAAPPPEVPDGIVGTPMTAGKNDPAAVGLQLSWDGTTCPGAVEYTILWGSAASWPVLPGGTYQVVGSVCDLTSAGYLWDPSPDAALQPGGLVWWLVLAGDDNGSEGSWGRDAFGSERSGSGAGGASGACGAAIKNLDATCP